MHSFEVKDQSPDAFVGRLKADLGSRKLGSFVSVERRGDDIVFKFSRLGTSEMRFAVQSIGTGFRAQQAGEKIAIAHRPFMDEFVGRMKRLLEKSGAKVS